MFWILRFLDLFAFWNKCLTHSSARRPLFKSSTLLICFVLLCSCGGDGGLMPEPPNEPTLVTFSNIFTGGNVNGYAVMTATRTYWGVERAEPHRIGLLPAVNGNAVSFYAKNAQVDLSSSVANLIVSGAIVGHLKLVPGRDNQNVAVFACRQNAYGAFPDSDNNFQPLLALSYSADEFVSAECTTTYDTLKSSCVSLKITDINIQNGILHNDCDFSVTVYASNQDFNPVFIAATIPARSDSGLVPVKSIGTFKYVSCRESYEPIEYFDSQLNQVWLGKNSALACQKK